MCIEDEDYDVDIRFERKLDENRGTILTPKGYVSGTPYKVVIENVGTPVNNNDATTKKYVDDLCSITWITGFYDGTSLIVSSTAYNDCYEAVTSNKQCYLKITENGRVSVMRLKGWLNYNDHSTHEDSFYFVDEVDSESIRSAEIKYSSAIFNSAGLEHIENKVAQWSDELDDVHYPTEKLVKTEFDILKTYIDDQYGPHLVWTGSIGATNNKARNAEWQITGLDLSQYKYVLCYIRGCNGDNADQEGSSHVVRVDLTEDMRTPRTNMFIGGHFSPYPQDNGVKYGSSVCISEDKTSVNFHYHFANTTGTTALERDGKLVKIEGYKN